jgi:uncharacterized protein YwbE
MRFVKGTKINIVQEQDLHLGNLTKMWLCILA